MLCVLFCVVCCEGTKKIDVEGSKRAQNSQVKSSQVIISKELSKQASRKTNKHPTCINELLAQPIRVSGGQKSLVG
jgi:hypothetical protein